jgi:hypothetical protein
MKIIGWSGMAHDNHKTDGRYVWFNTHVSFRKNLGKEKKRVFSAHTFDFYREVKLK